MTVIVKEYLDAVNDKGAYFIAYNARFKLFFLNWIYEEFSGSETKGIVKSRLAPQKLALNRHSQLWKNSVLFEGIGGSARVWPHEFNTNEIHWRLDGFGGAEVNGQELWHYRETITLRNSPWSLGINSLNWGRYISKRNFVVWIIARGAKPFTFCVHNSRSYNGQVKHSSEGIVTPLFSIFQTEQITLISKGDVSVGRSQIIKTLSRILLGRGKIEQDKGVYRCRLSIPGEAEEIGIAIAEEVTFSK